MKKKKSTVKQTHFDEKTMIEAVNRIKNKLKKAIISNLSEDELNKVSKECLNESTLLFLTYMMNKK